MNNKFIQQIKSYISSKIIQLCNYLCKSHCMGKFVPNRSYSIFTHVSYAESHCIGKLCLKTLAMQLPMQDCIAPAMQLCSPLYIRAVDCIGGNGVFHQ